MIDSFVSTDCKIIYDELVRLNNLNPVIFRYGNNLAIDRKHNMAVLATYKEVQTLEVLAQRDDYILKIITRIATGFSFDYTTYSLSLLISEFFEWGKANNWPGIIESEFKPRPPIPSNSKRQSIRDRYAENLNTLHGTARSETIYKYPKKVDLDKEAKVGKPKVGQGETKDSFYDDLDPALEIL